MRASFKGDYRTRAHLQIVHQLGEHHDAGLRFARLTPVADNLAE